MEEKMNKDICQKEFERRLEGLVAAHLALEEAKQGFLATLRGIVDTIGSDPARAALEAATVKLMAEGIITEETLSIATLNNQEEDQSCG